MELLMFFFLFVLAMGRAQECSEERAESCIENLLGSVLGDTSEEEVCGELKTSITCLRNAVDECLEEEDEEVEEGLKELEKVLKKNCEEEEQGEQEEEDEEMKKCFKENEDYVYECIFEGSTQALSLATEKGITDENVIKCSMFSLMTDCFRERVVEKCGDEAGSMLVKEQMTDVPVEILLACEAAGDIEQHSFQLIDKKKK